MTLSRIRRRRSFGVLVLGAALLLAAAARAESAVQPSGPQNFTIPQCDAPFILKFISKTKPIAVRTEGVPVASATLAPRWTLAWDTPTGGDTALSEWISTGKFAGGCPDTSGATIGVKVYLATGEPGHLQLKVAMDPSPKLATLPGALAAELDRWPWPGQGEDTVILSLHEAARGTSGLPPVQLWADPLKTATNEPARFRLQPPGLVAVPPGGQGEAVFKAVGRPSPGIYTTNLYVSAPGGGDIKLVPLTLKVRLYRGFLLLLLLVGVVGGWWFNKILAGRLDLQTARAAALERVSALLAQADETFDPVTKGDITAAAAGLQKSVVSAAAVADVTAASKAAEDAVTAATAAAAARLTEFTAALAAQSAIYTPQSPHDPEIAHMIATSSAQLRVFAARAAGGDVSGALQELTQATPKMAQDAISEVQSWLHSILVVLGAFGDWTDTTLTAARDALKTAVEGARGATDVATLLTDADAIPRQLDDFAVVTAAPAVAEVFRAAAATWPKLAALIGGKATAAAAAVALGDPLTILRRLGELRNDVEVEILKASNTAGQHTLLRSGDFVGALQVLANPPTKAAAAPERPGPALADTVERDAAPPAPAGIAPGPTLNAPARLQLGEVQTVLLVWPGSPGPPPTWSLDPPDSATLNPGQNQVAIRGRAPAFATLTATGSGWTASAKIAIGDPAVAPAGVATAESRALGNFLTVFTVVTTTGLGFGIFQGSWMGAYPDIFAALSWGLFGQFGLERVRTAVQPLLAKPFSGS